MSGFRKRFSNLSLARKIITITLLSSLATLITLCAVSFIREYRSYSERKVAELDVLARILESNTVAPLGFNDPDTARENAERLNHQSDIRSVTIFDAEGNPFASYSKDPDFKAPEAPSFEGEKWEENRLYFARPISLNRAVIGHLLIEVDTTELQRAISRSLWISVVLLVGGMVLTVLLASRIQGLITNPIDDLVKATRNVSQSEDYTHRVYKRYDDEIGSLVDSFNAMLETIAKRDRELTEINSNLERQVEARTADFRNRNIALELAIAEAKAASVAKSEFLATMSHELRTPLNAIIGMASLLKESDLNEKHLDYVDTINLSSNSLLSLINDLLDYSRIESGRLELDAEPYNLLSAIEDAFDIAVGMQVDQNLIYGTDYDPTLPRDFVGDAARIQQVLLNMINNAVKFTDRGSVSVEVRREDCNQESGECICISITDTGMGIPEDKKNQLFERFTQLDSSSTRKHGGAGLGLAICHRLVSAMDGTIDIKSEERKGSVFTIRIPFSPTKNGKTAFEPKPIQELEPLYKTINFFNIASPLRESLQQPLEKWNYVILDKPIKRSFRSINIVSAVADTVQGAAEKAGTIKKELAKSAPAIFICRKPHVVALRKRGFGNVVAMPVRLSDLRRALRSCEGIEASPDESSETVSAVPREPVRILLAEDDNVNQKVFLKIMNREGYEVDCVENGEDAVESYREKSHDIIFMDLRMPVMDGKSAMERIRQKFPANKQPWIIAFTANAEVESAEELLESGMDDYMTKPVRTIELREAMNRYYKEQQERVAK